MGETGIGGDRDRGDRDRGVRDCGNRDGGVRDGGRHGWGESGVGRQGWGERQESEGGVQRHQPQAPPLSSLRELWVSLQVGGHVSQPPICPLDTQGAGARLNLFSGQISGPGNHSQTPSPSSNVCLEPGGASFWSHRVLSRVPTPLLWVLGEPLLLAAWDRAFSLCFLVAGPETLRLPTESVF